MHSRPPHPNPRLFNTHVKFATENIVFCHSDFRLDVRTAAYAEVSTLITRRDEDTALSRGSLLTADILLIIMTWRYLSCRGMLKASSGVLRHSIPDIMLRDGESI